MSVCGFFQRLCKLSYVLTVCLLLCLPMNAYAEDAAKESTYDRVLRTGIIRCGYVNYPPYLIVDPAAKVMSGIAYDIAEELARVLNLKIEWTEEVGWANTVEALRSRRVDAICTSFWQNPVEGKYLGFTVPMFYSPVGAYVKADNTTLKRDLSNVNDPAVRVSASDGALSFFIAQRDYPKATILSLPNMTDETQMLMEVASRKADITFIETYLGEKFIKKNRGTLKNLTPDKPVRLFGNTFPIPMGDVAFKSMLDSALIPMIEGGIVDRIIKKYEEVPNEILRVAPPYQAAQRH